MKFNTFHGIKVLFAAIALVFATTAVTLADSGETDKIIDRFLTHVDSNENLTSEQKATVKATVKELREDEYGKDRVGHSMLQRSPD